MSSRSIAAELLQEFSALGANDRARTEVPSALGEMTAGVSVIKDPKSVAQIVSQAVKDADAPTSDAGTTPDVKPKPQTKAKPKLDPKANPRRNPKHTRNGQRDHCSGLAALSLIRAVTPLTGVSKTTVTKLLVDAGQAAAWYQDRVFQNLECRRLQVDEIWGFVSAKAKNAKSEKKARGESQRRPRFGCFWGAFSPWRRQIRSTHLSFTS